MSDVVVTMTSWKKRINNVPKAVVSLLLNSEKPRSIELNLSEEEFPNKEKDLPADLLLLADTTCLNINWVGKNTKSFKKLLPTLRKYWNEKDLCIMTADDDILYQKGIIAQFHGLIEKHQKCPVCFGKCCGSLGTQAVPRGGATMYKVGFFNEHIFDDLTDEIIATNEDDWYYAYYFAKHDHRTFCFTGVKLNFFKANDGHNYSTSKTRALLKKLLDQK